MNPSDQKNLFDSLNKLTSSNELLAKANYKALNIADRHMHERDELVATCREIYESLDIKEKRSVAEESFFKGLRHVLQK